MITAYLTSRPEEHEKYGPNPRSFPLRAYTYVLLIMFLIAYSGATELGEKVIYSDPEIGERITEQVRDVSDGERWRRFGSLLDDFLIPMFAGVGIVHILFNRQRKGNDTGSSTNWRKNGD